MPVSLNILQKINKSKQSSLAEIEIDKLVSSRFNPRSEFLDCEISLLAKSISSVGLLQPLVVRPVDSGQSGVKFEVVCGERRLRAAEAAGLRKVPCVVTALSDRETEVAALTENLQRRELNCFEQAEAFARIISEYQLTQSSLALMLGISRLDVENKLRLLSLGSDLRAKIIYADLTERHARALLSLDPSDQEKFLSRAIDESLTPSQLESAIAEYKSEESRKKSYRRRAAVLGDVRLFFNTVERAVKIMKLAGVSVKTQKIENEEQIEYVIRISKK